MEKVYLYCIYRFSPHEIHPFQNLSLEFILKVFLRFHKFQPRYSYKIYSYRKKRVYATVFCNEFARLLMLSHREYC